MTVYANAGAFKQALEARLRAASTSGVALGTLVGAVQAFLDPLLAGRVTGTWTPTTWSWSA